jgi:putative acetyltransferase
VSIVVRAMRREEAPLFFDIHSRAIRGLAAGHYTSDVIDSWIGRIDDASLGRFLENTDREIRLLAELHGVPVGLGCLVVQNSELRACYVVPEAARKGVGSALVREMERIAIEHGLDHLSLHASVNAEPFYRSLGYEALGRGDHTLRSGVRMIAISMRKDLPERQDHGKSH